MIVAFIVAIGILVSVHEYGHFWMARRVGIRVLRFSVGFGKPLWKRTGRDGVEYMVAAIPLGGYVKLLDEREGNVAPEDAPFSYNRAPVWKRILTLLAGPFANLIFAVLAYWLLLMVGIPSLKPVVGDVTTGSIAAQAGLRRDDLITSVQSHETGTREEVLLGVMDSITDGRITLTVRDHQGQGDTRTLTLELGEGRRDLTDPENMMTGLGFEFWLPSPPAIIGAITPGGAAEQAGLKSGDEVLSLDGQPVTDFASLVKLVTPRMNREVPVVVQRGDQRLSLSMTIGAGEANGKTVGRIGVGPQITTVTLPDEMRALQQYAPVAAFLKGVQQTWDTSTLSLKIIWKMLVGEVSTKNLSGAISMVEYSGAAASQGLLSFINWLALISISIGVFNLLPVPMLDGGQIVYQLVELAKGSPVSERVQQISQQIGIAVLLMLLSLTLYNDIARLLG